MSVTKLKCLGKSFEELKIIMDLAYKADGKTSLGSAILNAIQSKEYTTDEIISFVKSQALDNPSVMYDVIGKELTDKIINL